MTIFQQPVEKFCGKLKKGQILERFQKIREKGRFSLFGEKFTKKDLTRHNRTILMMQFGGIYASKCAVTDL